MNNILLITAIFGFVLTTLLFFKKSTNTMSTFFLGCFYLIISVYALQTFIVEAGYLNKFSWFFLWPLLLYHLIIIPIYFYFEVIMVDQFYWKKRYLLLLVPFVLGVVDVVAVYAAPNNIYAQILHGAITDTENRFKAQYWLMSLYEHYLIRHIWQAIFLLVLLPKLLVFIKEGTLDRLKVTLNNWLLFFWLILMIMSMVAIMHALEKWIGISMFNYLYSMENGNDILTIILYLIVFAIGVIPIYFPMILHGYPRYQKLMPPVNKTKQVAIADTDSTSDLKFGLEVIEIKDNLEQLHKKNLHLEQDFDVTKCARELEMPAHHLSYFLNQYYGLSFATYKNKLRIEHAKTLIKDGFLKNNTMEALAVECGYGNRSSFSKAFKSAAGLSPSEHVLKIQENR